MADDLLQHLIAPYEPTHNPSSTVADHEARPSTTTASSNGPSNPFAKQFVRPKNKMEIEMPIDVLQNISSIEDYINNPPPAAASSTANVIASGASPVPIALGTRSSKNTVDLHIEAQKYGLVLPAFSFEQAGDGIGWSGKMEFLGQVVEDKGPFSNKQQGKEALAGKALVMVRLGVENGEIVKPVKAKKVKAAGSGTPEPLTTTEPGSNYVGQLLEFQRANDNPQPTYRDFALGTKFTCTCTLDNIPDQTFGSMTDLFTSKKAARQNAAKTVVDHYKAKGDWPSDVSSVGGIRKKKKKIAQSSSPSSTPGMSNTSRCQELAVHLQLGTPEWRFAPEDPKAPGFHTVTCHFKNAGQHEGPIGEVRHIYGKKKAKDECARLTLEYLNDLQQRRVSQGMRDLGLPEEDSAMDVDSAEEFEDAKEF